MGGTSTNDNAGGFFVKKSIKTPLVRGLLYFFKNSTKLSRRLVHRVHVSLRFCVPESMCVAYNVLILLWAAHTSTLSPTSNWTPGPCYNMQTVSYRLQSSSGYYYSPLYVFIGECGAI
jgi:hypothetical protein